MLLKLSDDERGQLAQRISAEVGVTESIRNALTPRWNKAWQLYYADERATSLNVVEGIGQYPFSIWRAKADKLAGDLVATILGASPAVQCIEESPKGTNEGPLEDALQQLAERSGFLGVLPKAIVESANTNLGVVRLRPTTGEDGRVVGLECDWLDPKHFMAYPPSFEHLEQCRTVGHRYYRSLYEIQDDQRAGLYYDCTVWGGDSPDQYDTLPGRFDRNNDSSVVDLEDSYVELWEVITTQRIKGKTRKVFCTFARSSMQILSCEPYGPDEDTEYDRPWYEIVRLCRSEKRIFTNDSVAATVQGYCLAAQDMMNFIVTGALVTAMPVVWMRGYIGPAQATQIKPGQILQLDSDGASGVISMPFDAEKFAGILAKFEQIIDATIGVSQLATSQNLPAETKATAINAITAADQQSRDRYLDAASEAVEGVWSLLLMFLRMYPDELAQAYGGAVESLPREMLQLPYRMVVTGRSGAANPNALIQKLQMLMQMAQAPNSTLDYTKVEERVVDALDLPFDTSSLMKNELTELNQIAQEIMQAGLNPMHVIAAGMHAMEADATQPGSTFNGVQEPGMADDASGDPGAAGGASGVPGDMFAGLAQGQASGDPNAELLSAFGEGQGTI